MSHKDDVDNNEGQKPVQQRVRPQRKMGRDRDHDQGGRGRNHNHHRRHHRNYGSHPNNNNGGSHAGMNNDDNDLHHEGAHVAEPYSANSDVNGVPNGVRPEEEVAEINLTDAERANLSSKSIKVKKNRRPNHLGTQASY